jgi:hypothetical protein
MNVKQLAMVVAIVVTGFREAPPVRVKKKRKPKQKRSIR